VLTAATDIEYTKTQHVYIYDGSVYEKRCYNGFGKPDPSVELRLGPNITDWPKFTKPLSHMLVKLCAVIDDEVTTTDELIPSGETSSYRSNPIALSEFTLSRRVPGYVAAAKKVRSFEEERREGKMPETVEKILKQVDGDIEKTSVGSCIFAKKPGDGSAREQAASCQRVLGGLANICYEYATKRYRSNCINWGIVPFTIGDDIVFDQMHDYWIYIPDLRNGILLGIEAFPATVVETFGDSSTAAAGKSKVFSVMLECKNLSGDERKILTEGCLINYYAAR